MYLYCFTDETSSATPCPQVFQCVCWPQHWRGHPVSSGAAPGGCQGDRAAARVARPSHAEPGTVGIFFVIVRVGLTIRWCPLLDSLSTATLIWTTTTTKSEIVHQNQSVLFYAYAHQNHSLSVLFYVCSQQGDIRTPPFPPKKKKRKTNYMLQVWWQCLDSFTSSCFSCCSWWRGLRVFRWPPQSSGSSPAWSCCWKRPRLVLSIVTFRVWIVSTGGISPFHENSLFLCNSWIDFNP